MVQRLVGSRIAQAAMHRLHKFACTVVDEAGQIAAGRIMLHVSTEAGDELIGKRSEAEQDLAGLVLGHERNRRRSESFAEGVEYWMTL